MQVCTKEFEEQILGFRTVPITKARVWPVSSFSAQGLGQLAVSGERDLFQPVKVSQGKSLKRSSSHSQWLQVLII